MTSAAAAIRDLDRALAEAGEDIRLQRLENGAVVAEVTVRAMVRGYKPAELVNGITQQDVRLIFSPTPLDAAAWPAPPPFPAGKDPRVPRKGDRAVTTRGTLTVQAAAGLYMGEVLVRIEAQGRGAG